jgi:hypothetical protein
MGAEGEPKSAGMKRWKAFLTYAHNDNPEYVRSFYDVFTRELAQIGTADEFYVDAPQLDKGGDVRRYLEKHASCADYLIIFVGKHYPSRPFCLHEWLAFRSQFVDRNEVRDRLFIIEIDKGALDELRRTTVKDQEDLSKERAEDLAGCFHEEFWQADKRIISVREDGNLNQVFEQKVEYVAEVFANRYRPLPESPPPDSPGMDHDIILMGHPSVEPDRVVAESLSEVGDLLAGKGRAAQRWQRGWPEPTKVASLIDRGSVFVRAVNATEAHYVATNSVNLTSELVVGAGSRQLNAGGSKLLLGRSRLAIWLPPAVECSSFREKASATQDISKGTVLRADSPSELVNWLVGRGDLPAIAMEQTEDDIFRPLLTELLRSSGRNAGERVLEFNIFRNGTLLEQVLKMLAGRAIVVAHDLRANPTGDRREAYDTMTGKLKPLWQAAERAMGPGDRSHQPFGIAMISTFFDYFPSLEFPRREAGRWNIMRVRRASSTDTSQQLEKDLETWEPLVEKLGKWLQKLGGEGSPSEPQLGAGTGS